MKYLKIFEDFSNSRGVLNKIDINDDELKSILEDDKYCNSKHILFLYRYKYNFTDSQVNLIKKRLLEKIDSYIQNNDIDNLKNNIIGYVIDKGYDKGLNTRQAVFGYMPKTDGVSNVLCEVVGGGTLWLNYNNEDIHVGSKSDAEVGVDLFVVIQNIKNKYKL